MEQTFIERNRPEQPTDGGLKSKLPRVNPVLSFFLNRRNQLTLFVWVFSLSVPILFYYFLFHRQIPFEESFKTCSVNSTFRVPCGNFNLTKSDARVNCLQLSCCFDNSTVECFHSLPSAYFYTNESVASLKISTLTTLMEPKMYLSYHAEDPNAIKVTLSNTAGEGGFSGIPDDSTYSLRTYEDRMDIEIINSNTKKLLLTTGLGPLIVTQNYLEWTFFIGEHLFGLDQLYITGNETIRKVIYFNGDDHTTLPVFMAFQNNSFHSLLIEYEGPMEFIILPSRLIILRALGEKTVSFTLHTGPTLKDITQFYYKLYGYQPPPRWILEPHICRSGNDTLAEAIEKYEKFNEMQNNSPNLVKYASDCFHENLYFMLLAKGTTNTTPLTNVLNTLKKNSKFIMSIFPHIPMESTLYETALDLLYINPRLEEPQNGSYFGKEVAYPDYNNENVPNLITELNNLLIKMKVYPDSYSFNNNWASDNSSIEIKHMEGYNYAHENITAALSGTLLWNSTINDIEHINDHNNYGKYQVEAYKGNKSLSSIFSPNTNTIAQVENMNGTWANLKKTLGIVMSHSIYAHPLISIPICGSTLHFNFENQVELCTRWYIMGATMPIFRISSEPPSRDPLTLPSNHATTIALKAIKIRKMLSLYYYNMLSMMEPIVRPMYYDFYENITTFSLDEQYMVGDALLVAQPFLKDSYSQRIYFPPEAEVFYEFFGGDKYAGDDLGWVTFTAVPSDWFLFIRGGKIIPLLKEKSYSLVIALYESESEEEEEEEEIVTIATNRISTGYLYIDDEILNFEATRQEVTISNILKVKAILCDSEQELPTSFSSLSVYGLQNQVLVISLKDPVDLCEKDDDVAIILYDQP